MTNVDQFESVFRSAVKEVYQYEHISIPNFLIIADFEQAEAYAWSEQVKSFLSILSDESESVVWDVIAGGEFNSIEGLLAIVEEKAPDMICTYRHLHSNQWRQPYSLGDYVEVLTQATDIPIMVLPHPEAKRASAHALKDTNVVMAITDHITGDNRLVNYAARYTEQNGVMFLTHVEDQSSFDRFIDAISKIPTLDTDLARQEISKQLLKEPRDFILSCRAGIHEHRSSIHIEEIVTMGHHLSTYQELVQEHEVDLLVMNTKDADQLAMHGMAYPLAVELREIPLLML